MKYYSDETKQVYETEEELVNAEKELAAKREQEQQKSAAREARAKEVVDAYNKYAELMKAFVQDYGCFYTKRVTPESIFDAIFSGFWSF